MYNTNIYLCICNLRLNAFLWKFPQSLVIRIVYDEITFMYDKASTRRPLEVSTLKLCLKKEMKLCGHFNWIKSDRPPSL